MTGTTNTTPLDTDHWQARLTELLAKHRVAGAALGILRAGETSTFAAGFANVPEAIEATPDTLFQIGSITKVWTATQVMQLVDEGTVELDRRVLDYLPGVTLSEDSVTVRQLLNHTSGLLGDHFLDCGRGDDNLEKYVASMAELEQLHPVGVGWSYCNSAFSILGRLVEVIDGKTWDATLRARLIEPLGLTHTVTLPEEALRRRTACGHVKGENDGEFSVVPEWGIARSAGPAGLISARVADLLGFARLHLDVGTAPDGSRVLSAEAAAAMLTPTAEVTEKWLLGAEMGLGWFLEEWSGERVYSHGGATLGQNAYLKVIPGHDLAIALLTNGGGHELMHMELFGELASELAGLTITPLPTPTDGEIEDPDRYVGTFVSAGQVQRITVTDGALVLEIVDEKTGTVAMTLPLHPFLPDTLLAEFAELGFYMPVTFLDHEGVRSIHTAGRAKPEVADWAPTEPAAEPAA